MATRVKSNSPSPANTPVITSRTRILESPPSQHITNILSRDTFPCPLALRPHPSSAVRRSPSSELEVLNYHNARPEGQSKIVLPPATTFTEHAMKEEEQQHRQPQVQRMMPIREPPAHTGWGAESQQQKYQQQQRHEYYQHQVQAQKHTSYGWETPQNGSAHTSPNHHSRNQSSDTDRRSLSIQSLISSPSETRENGSAYYNHGLKRKGSYEDDMTISRSSRGTSVMSQGLSLEDPDVRDAVEALGGLKADLTHTTAPNSPNQTPRPQREPLISLMKSSPVVPPLVSTAISLSHATYNTSKTYIPPFRYIAERTENIASPVISTIGRRTGLDTYIRRGLTRHRSDDASSPTAAPSSSKRLRRADGSAADQTPSSSSSDAKALIETPSEKQQTTTSSQPRQNPGWQRRLYYSSTGLATALSDDSRRSLKYCVRILNSANKNLLHVIETLTSVLDELDRYLAQKAVESNGSAVAGYLPESYEQRRQRIAETVDRVKDEAMKTLKQVIDIISRYAGGALPEQAREVVKRQLLAFPARWQAAAREDPNAVAKVEEGSSEQEAEAGGQKGKAVRVLVMAREGLEMMKSVSEVVEGTLVSAEQWCETLGKKKEEREVEEGEMKGHKRAVSWVEEKGEVRNGDMDMDRPAKTER